MGEADDEWTEALQCELDDRTNGAWSLHLAADGWMIPVIEPPRWRWRPQGLRTDLFRSAVELSR
jgi:hypothetical protein